MAVERSAVVEALKQIERDMGQAMVAVDDRATWLLLARDGR